MNRSTGKRGQGGNQDVQASSGDGGPEPVRTCEGWSARNAKTRRGQDDALRRGGHFTWFPSVRLPPDGQS
jgi:hypothetical protein